MELRGRNVFVVVDNTTAKAGIRKGVSKSFSVNLAVGRLFDAIAEKGLQQIRVAYIRSAENPADEPSRNLEFHTPKLHRALASIQQLPSVWGSGSRVCPDLRSAANRVSTSIPLPRKNDEETRRASDHTIA